MAEFNGIFIALKGRGFSRRVKVDGRIVVDGMAYYVKHALAGQDARSEEKAHQEERGERSVSTSVPCALAVSPHTHARR
ncbi:MAG TPA: hypothetical protein VH593_11760 [Ktedonobacteraceae bacterium]